MNHSLHIHFRKMLATEAGERLLEVNTHVHAGELLAVSGNSGCGKSTLLRILAGLSTPDEGVIQYGDVCWYDSSRRICLPPQQRCCGLVFQDYALFPNMTLEENLHFALRSSSDAPWVRKIAATLGIAELLHRRPFQVSGGQKQRAAFARALVSRPTLLLLDEPFSALDWELRWRLQDDLRKWHQEFGCTTLVVSHDLLELFRVADRMIRLDGPPPSLKDLDQVINHYAHLRNQMAMSAQQ